jgi:hypothetical protein
VIERLEGRVVPSTITVMNTDDTGAGSLRAAIEQANVDAAQDTITFAPSVTGTIVLANSLPDLAASMNIVGPGPSALTVARNGAGGTPLFGIFTVSAGAQVAISGLTITGGNATAFGGGIENSGTLSLVNAVISGNSAGTFPTDYVSSAGNGGGIDNSGTLSITDSTISGNSAYGGLNGLPGLDETPGQGGGINNTGNMSVTDSTVNGNSASLGGGIDNFGALAVVCSTVSGDTALGYFGKYMNEGFPQGGGIDNSGTLSVTYSTISGNIAVEGGGIANSAKASIVDTIVAGNIRDSVNGDANDIDGDVTGSNNLIGPGGSGGLIGGQDGNIVLTSLTGLGLSTLGNYGGPTQTIGLLPDSPAIDAGIAVSGVTTDQRGITRPQGSAPDIGAFESRGFIVTVVSGEGQSTKVGSAFPAPLVVAVVSPFGEPVAGGLVTFTGPATGAAAEFVGSPAIIDNNGQASATASANGFGGNYSVIVASGFGSVAFSLTNIASPTVVSLKRFGFHDQPTLLVLTFSEPMDATRADNRGNYRLVWASPAQRQGAKHDRPIPIRYAQYNAANQTVTIRPIQRLPLRRTFLLTVVGTPPGGLTCTSGIFLLGAGTGQPGSDYTGIVNRKSLAGQSSRH